MLDNNTGIPMLLFFGLFEPYEVKRVKSIAFDIIGRYATVSETTLKGFILTLLEKQRKSIVNMVRGENVPASNVAVFFVSESMTRLLSSGQFHTYRGVLSAKGQDILNAYKSLQKQLVEDGKQTEEDSDEEIEYVLSRIAKAG